MELWYQRMERKQVEKILVSAMGALGHKRLVAGMRSARARDSKSAVRKLTEVVDGHRRFRADPPDLIRPEFSDTVMAQLTAVFDGYRESLTGERRVLFDRFRVVDFAHKVVGVGSVGLYSWAVLLEGNDEDDVLVLQFKQAESSVLESLVGGEARPRGSSRRRGPAAHAGGVGCLPRLDDEPQRRRVLRAPAARHEVVARGDGGEDRGPHRLCPADRRHARARPRPLRRTRRRSPGISARARSPTARSPTSESPTPTWPSRTTRTSSGRSPAAGSRRGRRAIE